MPAEAKQSTAKVESALVRLGLEARLHAARASSLSITSAICRHPFAISPSDFLFMMRGWRRVRVNQIGLFATRARQCFNRASNSEPLQAQPQVLTELGTGRSK